MTTSLQGLFCPITTPFDADGGVSPDRLAEQVRIYASYDLGGLVLFGTSGEGPLLEAAEEESLLTVARQAAPDEWVLIAQIGKESTRATRAAARRAEAGGANALLCLPPRYFSYDQQAIAAYYRSVAGATDLPLLAYNIPVRSKVEVEADLIIELAAEGVLAGIKDSSGDLGFQSKLRSETDSGFSVLNGSAPTTLSSFRDGAVGVILAVADAAPETALRLIQAHSEGDDVTAEGAQEALLPLASCFGSRFGVPGIKAALDERGWPGGGPPRPPLRPLNDDGREAIRRALRTADSVPSQVP